LKKVINIILTNCIHKVELIEVQTILDLLGGKVQTDTQKSTGKGAVRALSSLKQSANFKYTWTRIPFMLVVLGLFLASCSISPVGTNSANPPFNAEEIANGPSGRLVVYSGRSEPLIQPVLERFKSYNPGYRDPAQKWEQQRAGKRSAGGTEQPPGRYLHHNRSVYHPGSPTSWHPPGIFI
jgi:hypothetical protein